MVLGLNPSAEKQMRDYLSGPEGWTPYPVGIPSDRSVIEFCDLLKLDSFPAAVVVRDGTLLWAGEIKKMPEWVAETARLDSFDKNRFAEEDAKQMCIRDSFRVFHDLCGVCRNAIARSFF